MMNREQGTGNIETMRSARWLGLLVVLLALVCLASRCNGNRWANPETGIPPHPGGTPEVGYISQPPPPEPDEDAGADADFEPDGEADATESSSAETSGTGNNPY